MSFNIHTATVSTSKIRFVAFTSTSDAAFWAPSMGDHWTWHPHMTFPTGIEHHVNINYAWTSLLCLFRPCKLEKPLLHIAQTYGLSPVWVRMCKVRKQDWTKPFSQMLHLNGLSPVWYLLCIFNSAADLKDLPQSSHLKGLSPVWIKVCLTKASLPKKPFPQCSHGKRSPLWWKLSCFRRHLLEVKVLSHWLQGKIGVGFSVTGSPEWCTRSTCRVSVTPCRNFLPHSQQRNGYALVCFFWCSTRSEYDLNLLLQWGHWNGW